MSKPIGRIAALHRYPVKSMAGEEAASVHVTRGGVLGDRSYALIDQSTGRVASAKRPRKWAGILDYAASFVEPPRVDLPIPPVQITLPDGTTCSSTESEDLDKRLSHALENDVRLVSAVPEGATFEYHWPDIDGLEYQGRTYRDEITEHEMPPGTFFDSATLLILTSASLEHLGGLAAPSRFASERFRPNIVIETMEGESGFVENEWVGQTLGIGDELRVIIAKPCIRCVMVNLAQGDLPSDPQILKSVFEHNDGCLGVKGTVARVGEVQVGDAVWVD
jgi:uncharacterized protein YcbX